MPGLKISRVGVPHINWRALTLELFVVFIGLLGALQVDQMRDNRLRDAAETRYLERLESEFVSFEETMDFLTRFIDRNLRGAEAVDEALRAGELLPENRSAFEYGLIHAGHLPAIEVPRATYDEMISSGALARMQSEELKRALQDFYSLHQTIESNFSWWRQGALRTMDRLLLHVDYSISESSLDEEADFMTRRRVEYDFDALLADRQIRGGFFWAADTHRDWQGWSNRLIERGMEVQLLVRAELASRD